MRKRRKKRTPEEISVEVLEAENSKNLPKPYAPHPPTLTEMTPDHTTEEIIREDAKHIHYALERVYLTWPKAKQIDDVCKLALTTAKLLQLRRDFLNRQLGHLPANKGEGGGIVAPLE